jgi:DNA-binding LacI/PurR family transcriptional regulator
MSDAPRRPTLRDVASRAGVSFKTVSRVVNGESGVSVDLVERVEKAIDALGYRPDDRARRLRLGGARTGVIGFVLVDVGNPFFASILRGIEEVARQHGCLVITGSSDGMADRQDQLVEAFISRRVDGLIVVTSSDRSPTLDAEVRRGTPLVYLDLEPTAVRADLVRSDHHGGTVLATEHLLAHGHRDIAFFGDDPSIFSARLRRDGFIAAMDRAGVAVPEHRFVHHHGHTEEWREIALDYLRGTHGGGAPATRLGAPSTLGAGTARSSRSSRAAAPRRPPTAIVTAQNFITLGTIHALHELGLEQRIAVVGFDDVELGDVVTPGITVVPQQPKALGRRAATMLFQRIDGSTVRPRREIFPSELIARGSGEIRPRASRRPGRA